MDAARYARQSDPEANPRFRAGYTWNVPDRPPGFLPKNRNRRQGDKALAAANTFGKQQMLISTIADSPEQAVIRLATQWEVA